MLLEIINEPKTEIPLDIPYSALNETAIPTKSPIRGRSKYFFGWLIK